MARCPGTGLHREAIEQDGNAVRETLVVADDCAFFDGHFEAFSIFPAVAQLQTLIVDLAHERFGDLGPLREARRLKFLRPIRPGARVSLHLRRDGSRVAFELDVDGVPASTGTLEFESP